MVFFEHAFNLPFELSSPGIQSLAPAGFFYPLHSPVPASVVPVRWVVVSAQTAAAADSLCE
jgi:hypothetical protein